MYNAVASSIMHNEFMFRWNLKTNCGAAQFLSAHLITVQKKINNLG